MKLSSNIWNTWKTINISFGEIKSFDFDDFSKEFRSSNPVLLVYRLKYLPWVGVAKCAPIDHVLWATEFDAIGQYEKLHKWVSPLVDDKQIYEKFKEELKGVGLNKEIPWTLLSPYCNWGSYLGRQSLSFKSIYFGEYRVNGTLVPVEYADNLICYASKQLEQFGKYSFLPVREGEENSDERRKKSRFQAQGYMSAKLWKHPLMAHKLYTDENSRKAEIENRCLEIDGIIKHIESGNDFDFSVYYDDAVRSSPFFSLVTRRAIHPDYDYDIRLYGYRARLIRLLGWPTFYRYISSVEFWDRLRQIKSEKFMSASGPYNFADELFGFKQEMENKYPVLLENPLLNLTM